MVVAPIPRDLPKRLQFIVQLLLQREDLWPHLPTAINGGHLPSIVAWLHARMHASAGGGSGVQPHPLYACSASHAFSHEHPLIKRNFISPRRAYLAGLFGKSLYCGDCDHKAASCREPSGLAAKNHRWFRAIWPGIRSASLPLPTTVYTKLPSKCLNGILLGEPSGLAAKNHRWFRAIWPGIRSASSPYPPLYIPSSRVSA